MKKTNWPLITNSSNESKKELLEQRIIPSTYFNQFSFLNNISPLKKTRREGLFESLITLPYMSMVQLTEQQRPLIAKMIQPQNFNSKTTLHSIIGASIKYNKSIPKNSTDKDNENDNFIESECIKFILVLFRLYGIEAMQMVPKNFTPYLESLSFLHTGQKNADIMIFIKKQIRFVDQKLLLNLLKKLFTRKNLFIVLTDETTQKEFLAQEQIRVNEFITNCEKIYKEHQQIIDDYLFSLNELSQKEIITSFDLMKVMLNYAEFLPINFLKFYGTLHEIFENEFSLWEINEDEWRNFWDIILKNILKDEKSLEKIISVIQKYENNTSGLYDFPIEELIFAVNIIKKNYPKTLPTLKKRNNKNNQNDIKNKKNDENSDNNNSDNNTSDPSDLD